MNLEILRLILTPYLCACVFTDLVRRHAGVLGLSACILSSPYDVPDWMPQILMDLSDHLNDPQPIEVHTHTLAHTHMQISSDNTVCAERIQFHCPIEEKIVSLAVLQA